MATSKSAPAKKTPSDSAKPATTKKPAAKKASTAPAKKSAVSGKPATSKSTAKPATGKPARNSAATAKKTAPTKKTAATPTPEQRYRMVQEAAYYIAERNGFAGEAMDYWIEAEAEIGAMLGKIK